MQSDDESFIVYTWLASHRRSPIGVAMGAHLDKSPEYTRFWLGHEKIAHSLLRNASTTVAEAEAGGAKVIVGYVVGEPDCVHYVLTRRRFQHLGVARDLLMPWLFSQEQVFYSHLPPRDTKIPSEWRFDPYRATAFLK